ncbi:MAG: right-handed parallel beta-helix repeat-containing protein [Solibacillus sp.]
MAIIKVSTSVFSTYKTVERALQKVVRGDEIQLAAGKYKETITIHEHVRIFSKERENTIVEGLIVVPKGVTATFEHLTIIPSIQIYVEGTVHFKYCTFHGDDTSVILSLYGGEATLEHCTLKDAQDVGVALLNNSKAHISHCLFEGNGKSHFLLEQSALELISSECSLAKHALWIKNGASVHSENCKLHHQAGTQIIVQGEAHFTDYGSTIEHGQGNGLYATKNCTITLHGTVFLHHKLPQIWAQQSKLVAHHCIVQHGEESGIMLRDQTEAELEYCVISHHKIANVQVTLESLLNMTNSQIHQCTGVGVQVREKSIVNFSESIFAQNTLSQTLISEESIASFKNCLIKDGLQIGLFTEKKSVCTLVHCQILNHANSAITAVGAELTLIDSTISGNKGNGLLVVNETTLFVDTCKFSDNDMPHIAGKSKTTLHIHATEFSGSKALFVLEDCELLLKDSQITNGDGVQVEIADRSKAEITHCFITNGATNGIKAIRDSTLHIYDSQISQHKMPQIVINDSSLIFKNSELLDGVRNGFIIENNAEAFIQDSFISKHRYPQVWIDLNSNVELSATQLKDGSESDIYAQNKSSVVVSNCLIHNEHFIYNVQAVNHSTIDLLATTIENTVGETFYSENNSYITHNLDEAQ